MALQGQEQALTGTSGAETVKRLFDKGSSQVTKADSQRRHHEYDLAESTYTSAIGDLTNAINRGDESVTSSNAKERLMMAYLGKGDCAYFRAKPNYKTASSCYEDAINLLHQTKSNYAWTQMQTVDQLYLFLRNADSYFMRGLYPQASAARLHIPELMRSRDRGLQDGSYVALNRSKIAEEAFRQNQLDEAREKYKEALKAWQQDEDIYSEEQAIVVGRLAEIAKMQGSADQHSLFLEFDRLAEKVRHDDPKLLRTQFFSDAYQDYANYLWKHYDIANTLKMHDRSLQCTP